MPDLPQRSVAIHLVALTLPAGRTKGTAWVRCR